MKTDMGFYLAKDISINNSCCKNSYGNTDCCPAFLIQLSSTRGSSSSEFFLQVPWDTSGHLCTPWARLWSLPCPFSLSISARNALSQHSQLSRTEICTADEDQTQPSYNTQQNNQVSQLKFWRQIFFLQSVNWHRWYLLGTWRKPFKAVAVTLLAANLLRNRANQAHPCSIPCMLVALPTRISVYSYH